MALVATATARMADRRRGQLAVALAAVAWSTAGPLQRELSLDAPSQVAGRAFFAMIALFAFTALTHRGSVVAPFRAMGRAGIAVAVSIAVASSTFIVALNHTTVARVLFVQAAAPMIAALLGFVVLRERVTRRTAAAMAVALAGVALMIGDPGGGDRVGDALSVVMAFGFATSIVITRRRSDISMAPATCLAQVLLLIVFVPFADLGRVGGANLLWLVALGFGQMGVGLALFTVGARLIPATEVALITLLEVVLGPLLVWITVSETPGAVTLAGGAVVVAAVALQTLGDASGQASAPPPPP